MADDREFDIVAYGATGFTGQLICAYLAEKYGGSVRWAMAGRNLAKLARVRDEHGLPQDTPLIEADAADIHSVRRLAARTRVLISTVGPYQLYGSSAVEACASAGTDYIDMTGEPVWMRDMMDVHTVDAQASGARLLFSCGFDSIPFDLSVQQLQARCMAQWGRPSSRIRCRVRGLEGGVSGGTSATRRATEAAIALRPEILDMFDDPFLLTPGWRGADQPRIDQVAFDPAIGRWVAPFYMAFINTKHVHRTNFLSGQPYGSDFQYDEAVAVDGEGEDGRRAAEARAAFDPFAGAEGLGSGEGPSADDRASNFFDLIFIADGPDGERLALTCRGDRDPGYETTARMMVEAALCLGETPSHGGFWTPASLMGDRLAARLTAHAEMTFQHERPDVFGR